jgi:hypothetical protein
MAAVILLHRFQLGMDTQNWTMIIRQDIRQDIR